MLRDLVRWVLARMCRSVGLVRQGACWRQKLQSGPKCSTSAFDAVSALSGAAGLHAATRPPNCGAAMNT